jgi:hypothetical protein
MRRCGGFKKREKEGGKEKGDKRQEVTHIIPPCTTGISIPNFSVKNVLIGL